MKLKLCIAIVVMTMRNPPAAHLPDQGDCKSHRKGGRGIRKLPFEVRPKLRWHFKLVKGMSEIWHLDGQQGSWWGMMTPRVPLLHILTSQKPIQLENLPRIDRMRVLEYSGNSRSHACCQQCKSVEEMLVANKKLLQTFLGQSQTTTQDLGPSFLRRVG